MAIDDNLNQCLDMLNSTKSCTTTSCVTLTYQKIFSNFISRLITPYYFIFQILSHCEQHNYIATKTVSIRRYNNNLN